VVATDNGASVRAFARAGFRAAPETCTLLVYHPADAVQRPQLDGHVQVHEAANGAEARRWLEQFGQEAPAAGAAPPCPPSPEATSVAASRAARTSLLLASQEEKPAGYAELVEVQTLLYRGAWIESLVAPFRAAREALVEQAIRRGMTAGWDEIGAMVPQQNWPLRNALLAQGFRSLGDFRWLVADLPLRDAIPRRQAGKTVGNPSGSGHV
jgi:hypothetical protein